MFDDLIVRPIFNLLELIYALVPRHDLGVAIILFTILVRLALWPLVKKQLHHAQAMRKLQPELKKLKKAAAGDRQKEARLQMELYKEHEIRPFTTIGTLIIQIPIFIGLYQAVLKLINNPDSLITFSYQPVRELPYIQQLSHDVQKFDHSLFGLVDLTRNGVGDGGVYFGAVVLALLAAIVQYYQSKIMMPSTKDSRKLSELMKEAAAGKQADQSEVAAAVGRAMLYFLPFITFIFAVSVPSALSLYLITTSGVGYLQQAYVFKQDQKELQEISEEKEEPTSPKPKSKKNKKPSKKRRKK
jgi:YidC/Oxa1 family membrane protein insertase